ncbi:hypothetical protein [Mycolicibacterium conceptionense]|uniref:hypothetical protein n=1 Tax=Mycolicibacterium conceptionense TaxID=451644 RepID=UPI000AAC5159|nr:hypothetical protein [Mycolicibacterium conceptionense]
MSDRIKVEPVHAANGRIQGWAVNRGNRELAFRTSQVAAMNYARMASWTPEGDVDE